MSCRACITILGEIAKRKLYKKIAGIACLTANNLEIYVLDVILRNKIGSIRLDV